MVEDAIFAARQIETLLFGEYKKVMPINLNTDSEGTFESIASSKQIGKKTLRNVISDLQERFHRISRS